MPSTVTSDDGLDFRADSVIEKCEFLNVVIDVSATIRGFLDPGTLNVFILRRSLTYVLKLVNRIADRVFGHISAKGILYCFKPIS